MLVLLPGRIQSRAEITQNWQLGEKQGVLYKKLMDDWKATIPAKRFADPAEIAG
jgi:hypothetical protein